MSFSDVGVEWFCRPSSVINGRADFLRLGAPQTEDGGGEDHTPAWLRCALSQEPFENRVAGPIVGDNKGHLLRKEALIGALLERRMPEHLRHIRSLRDIVDCALLWCAGFGPVCPITGDDLRVVPASLLWPCGCVVSRAGIGLTNGGTCEACGCGVTDAVALNRCGCSLGSSSSLWRRCDGALSRSRSRARRPHCIQQRRQVKSLVRSEGAALSARRAATTTGTATTGSSAGAVATSRAVTCESMRVHAATNPSSSL